jgi:hypothetical protein
MIQDEEQRARELEQEIALMQGEGQYNLQHGPPLQQRVPAGIYSYHSAAPSFRTSQLFKGSTTLMSEAPWLRNSKHRLGPPTSGQAPTPNTTSLNMMHS